MAEENEVHEEVEETLDLPEVEEGQEDTTDWKAEATKLREKAIKQRETTKSIKAKLAEKDAAIAALAGGKKADVSKTGELDETTLDYLDLKGIVEPEDIKVIEIIVKKTGMSVRDALKDDYVTTKLATNKANREVKGATPSSTRRSGASTDTLEIAVARYKASGYKELPSDFKLRSAVVNAVSQETDSNQPAWRR